VRSLEVLGRVDVEDDLLGLAEARELVLSHDAWIERRDGVAHRLAALEAL
jgi:hypothetical protein